MITIRLSRKEVRYLYFGLVALDAFFVLMNTPLMTVQQPEGHPAQVRSFLDFIRYQLDLKSEQNIATWYSSVLLLAGGVVALLNLRLEPVSSKLKWLHRAGWSGIAFVLIALSADETATIHETLAQLINFMNQGTGRPTVRVGAGDWIPILLPLIVLVAVGMVLFFALVLRHCRAAFVLGLCGVGSWIGAIFAESIEAGMWKLNLSRSFEGMIEESFEIIGTTLLLIAFSEFLSYRQTDVEESAVPVARRANRKLEMTKR